MSPELKRAVAEADGVPIRLIDAETARAFVLVSAEAYERLVSDEEDRHEQGVFHRAAKANAKARHAEDE